MKGEMTAGPRQQVAFDFATSRHDFPPDKLHGGLEVMEPEVLGGVHAEHVPHHRGLWAQRDERVRQERVVGRTQTVSGHQHGLGAVHLVQNAERRASVAHALQRTSVVVQTAVAVSVPRGDFHYRHFGNVARLSFQSEHATWKPRRTTLAIEHCDSAATGK